MVKTSHYPCVSALKDSLEQECGHGDVFLLRDESWIPDWKASYSMAQVTVIGLGYVGLTTAVGLANLGHFVVGHDVSEKRLFELQSGRISILEPGLEDALRQAKESVHLSFEASLSASVARADFIFVCVPTPQGVKGEIVLDSVLDVVLGLEKELKTNSVLIIKSTLPVGGINRISEIIQTKDFGICYNPEFLRQGSALNDFMYPERVVVGSDSEFDSKKVAGLYTGISAEILLTDPSSAELIKLASNSYLGMRLSFANEIAFMCEKLGASFRDVSRGMGLDPRIGLSYFSPGPGWGGSCLPKDSSGLSVIARELGAQSPLIEATIDSNHLTQKRVVDRMSNFLGGNLVGKRIGVWGVSFKAGTGDLRGSPAIEIIERLVALGALVSVYDPHVEVSPYKNINFRASAIAAVDGADALLVLSDWTEFRNLEPKRVHEVMHTSVVFDARRILDAESWKAEVDSFRVIGESA
jgi:UDPglucose 6-dehydrogenase